MGNSETQLLSKQETEDEIYQVFGTNVGIGGGNTRKASRGEVEFITKKDLM